MNTASDAANLEVYLASEAPVGVVLRRGPSDWARLSLWHTDTDEVEHGQWFAGRVYERRCDVSPDGALFAYFARKSAGGADVDADSWIAISRPPWFTALALWGIGGTYCAGAHFVSAGALRIGGPTGAPDIGALPPWLRLTADAPYIDHTPEWTSRTVYFNRLLRDGWVPEPSIDVPRPSWRRAQPGGTQTLRMASREDADFATHGERDALEFAVSSADGTLITIGHATWADWDQRGRLVVAQEGRLVEWRGEGDVREIADFRGQRPDPQPSPPSAGVWPRSG